MNHSEGDPTPPPRPQSPPLTWVQLVDMPAGAEVNVAIEIQGAAQGVLDGRLIESSESDPFTSYRRSTHQLRVHWNEKTRIVMGTVDDLLPGVPVWVRGEIRADDSVEARSIAVLRKVAHVEG